MSLNSKARLRAEAIAWRIRLSEPHAQDWDGFTEWMERDPDNAPAYDAVALDDLALDPILIDWMHSPIPMANDNEPVSRQAEATRRWVAGGFGFTAAAAAAASFFLLPQPQPSSDYYLVATAPGEQRSVTLDGRDRITLNGETRIKLDRSNPRFASLLSGEAAFNIVHDAKVPFIVELGTDRLLDVGTAFNVVRSSDGHKVQVSEGSVVYNPAGEQITLTPGQTLSSRTKERRIILGQVPIAQVGGWQRGRLSYRSAPLASVAADLSRSIGTPITVHPGIGNRPFTGTIEIDRNESRMFDRLEPLLDVAARRDAKGWTFEQNQNDMR